MYLNSYQLTVLSFQLKRYIVAVAASVPVTSCYLKAESAAYSHCEAD